jgi:hypothetical protein
MLAFSAVALAEVEEGFEPLFKPDSLEGWVAEGPTRFLVRGDEIFCPGVGNDPTWLRSEESYENFVLRFQFKMWLYGEGGIFLHAPMFGRCSRVGFEVQLSDELRNRKPSVISTGAIFDAVPPAEQAARPLGEWNDVEVEFDWPTLRVTLNGKLVQDLDCESDPELRRRLRSGFLGLQDRGKPYYLKNMRVKKLPNKDTEREIFNGQDLTGWSVLRGGGTAKFDVDRGIIVAKNGNGYLISDESFQDVDVFMYVRTDRFANGGVFVRWKSLVPKDRGYEIQIEDIPDSNNPTGSIYDWAKATGILPFTPGEWYPLQIHLKGKECVVRVNGVTVAQADDLDLVRSGPIALQMHSANKTIQFGSIRVRSLDPSPISSEPSN